MNNIYAYLMFAVALIVVTMIACGMNGCIPT